MKKRLFMNLLLITIMLTGCMYPEEQRAQNQVPYEDQVKLVQAAVEKYQSTNGGLLPIKNKDMDTPIYEKYPIDFEKLVPTFLSEAPGNAYESGGIFQYVLIDVETKPTVKLFDLRIAEQIRELKLLIQMQKYPPYKAELSRGVFTLDYQKLGYEEEPVVISPYTNQNLSFVITGMGEIYLDYKSDLFQVMQKTKPDLEPGEDIRRILVDQSMFVPAYSLPYTIDNETKEPIFLVK